ncbi:MAG: hypothetical protein GEU98_11290 [Pseudonocardiaceae bacterium]|nr:hypothetical protein [Pseudonocardiaceae bacterium]
MLMTTLTRPELTAADRCDRCSAAAGVRALLPSGGELLFCGHHAREHRDRLIALEAEIQQSDNEMLELDASIKREGPTT